MLFVGLEPCHLRAWAPENQKKCLFSAHLANRPGLLENQNYMTRVFQSQAHSLLFLCNFTSIIEPYCIFKRHTHLSKFCALSQGGQLMMHCKVLAPIKELYREIYPLLLENVSSYATMGFFSIPNVSTSNFILSSIAQPVSLPRRPIVYLLGP